MADGNVVPGCRQPRCRLIGVLTDRFRLVPADRQASIARWSCRTGCAPLGARSGRQGRSNTCGDLFADTTLQPPRTLSRTEPAAIFSATNKIGNDCSGHRVGLLMGSNSEFLEETRAMATWLDVERLYLCQRETGQVLKLLPLVQLGPSPQSARNACYLLQPQPNDDTILAKSDGLRRALRNSRRDTKKSNNPIGNLRGWRARIDRRQPLACLRFLTLAETVQRLCRVLVPAPAWMPALAAPP